GLRQAVAPVDRRAASPRRQVLPRNRTRGPRVVISAVGHVWTAPGWQVLSSRVQQWSWQPCVRPVSAVHLTPGHNARRGSGPGHKRAFDNAVAQGVVLIAGSTGSALRAVRPFQPSHHAGCPTRSLSRRECDGFLIALAPGHHRPYYPGNLVGERDG